jgi:hypothetical protein
LDRKYGEEYESGLQENCVIAAVQNRQAECDGGSNDLRA